jgi:osmotically-inducible protein OsmY
MMKRAFGIVGGAGVALGALLAFFFDKGRGRRRRRQLIDQTAGFFRRRMRQAGRVRRGVGGQIFGMAMKATHLREQPKPQPDDATLARKVETEIFRPADVPKGTINVNAEDGVVYLRGEVPTPEMMQDLVEHTQRIQGVKGVKNLLHLPRTPAQRKA